MTDGTVMRNGVSPRSEVCGDLPDVLPVRRGQQRRGVRNDAEVEPHVFVDEDVPKPRRTAQRGRQVLIDPPARARSTKLPVRSTGARPSSRATTCELISVASVMT